MNFIIFSILPIIIVIVILFFVLIVLKNNYNNINNKLFSLFALFAGFWVLSVYLSEFFSDLNDVLFWTRMTLVGPILFCPVFLFFSYNFPNKLKILKKYQYFLIILPTLVFFILSFSKYNVERVWFESWGANFEPGILYYLFFVYIVIYFGLSFKNLYKSFKTSSSLSRQQIRFVFFGFLFGVVSGLTTNVILPLFDIASLSIIGPAISLVLLLGFTAYAMVKYRLMDIKVIIKRSTVFTFLVLIITAIFTLFSYVLSEYLVDATGVRSFVLNGVVIAILVTIGFEPLKKLLSHATDSFLFKAAYNSQEVLAEYSDKFSSTLELETLNKFITDKTEEVFKPAFVSLFLKFKDKDQYREVSISGEPVANSTTVIDPKLFKKIYNSLNKIGRVKDIIVREELKKYNERLKNRTLDQFVRMLEKEEVNLSIPIFVKEELVGIVFVGDKKSGDVYNQGDINVLEIMVSQAAVAIKNAQLYEEQRMFAQHLKKEVEKATEDLKVANKKLVQLDEAKSEFISIASHQLRTPLTVVKGYISMILEGNFGEVNTSVDDSLEKVYESNERLIQLVENLLNISRIESGRLQFNYEVINLETMIDSVVEELEGMAVKKGLKFSYKKPAKLLPKVRLDQEKIRQVVLNLIDNAIKYTKKGSVTVSIKKAKDNLEFCVSDSGMGISKEEMPGLFKKFTRGTGTALVHTEGTGLGLYVADQMIKSHKGKIWAESDGREKGAKFCFTLPIYKKKS